MAYKPNKSRHAVPITDDAKALVTEALGALPDMARREFLKNVGRVSLSVGSFALLGGALLTTDPKTLDAMLRKISRMNDGAQARLFDPTKLAPTYGAGDMTRPFPFNAYYPEPSAPVIDPALYKLELRGKVADKRPWTLPQLQALHRVDQTTRHVCVEGWSAIGNWGGVPLRDFLRLVGADVRAKYLHVICADDYYTTLDMPTVLHPQTLLATHFDGRVIDRAYGYPFKIRIPTKLGFKNPKYVMAMEVTDRDMGGYWEDQGYNWFSGL